MNKRKLFGRLELADVSLYTTIIIIATFGAFAGLFFSASRFDKS